MKDKFEKAIMKVLYVNRLHEIKTIPTRVKVMAKSCNTLHQQAMKDILNKISDSPRNIDLQFTLKEIAKENNIEL